MTLTGEAAQGQTVVSDMGCTTCHTSNGSTGAGPTFKGLAGSQVTLEGGKQVLADQTYLHTAITDPGKQIVDGYRPIMPKRDLTDEQVNQIIAYLQAIGTKTS